LSLKKLLEEKKKFREFLWMKQKEKREREAQVLEKIKKESEVWKYINKKRRKSRYIGNNIEIVKWKAHFKNLLGGEEKKEEAGRKYVVRSKEETEELQEIKIREVVKRMKRNKAAGYDELPMEVWKFAGKDLWKGLVLTLRQIWRENRIPKDWRKSIIVPIYKRGDPNVPSNYRGISLLCTAYKVYAELIRRRLEDHAERVGGIPETQTGFRKGKSTLDNIFTLCHLAQRDGRTEEREKRLYAFFADLSVAFDNVDRNTLWRVLREMNLEESLIKKIETIYEITEVMVKAEGKCTESFVTRRGVKQGCVLSPVLFNLYMAGIHAELKNRRIGGVEVGNLRIWELAYADDIVLLARNKVALEDMMLTLGRFLKERKLELNVEKSKIMVFNKKKRERGRKKRADGRKK